MFKREGCWKCHVELGDQALNIAYRLKDYQAVMELSIQLASTWFYLGNPAKCQELNQNSFENRILLTYSLSEAITKARPSQIYQIAVL
ncbi:hypothetical protein [Endozoicomonas sp. Mp262]|uniref:hypothetical protein n=1 Tax=Endozoicomonas sp. Mp262 TaxID=2919499 RepID=UPI0021D7DD73